MRAKSNTATTNVWLKVLISALIAVLASMLIIVLLAFLLQQQLISIDSINILNPIVKAIAAFVAGLLTVRKAQKSSWMFGAISGVSYMLLAFILFSVFAGELSITNGLLLDIVMCMVAGATAGVIYQLSR